MNHQSLLNIESSKIQQGTQSLFIDSVGEELLNDLLSLASISTSSSIVFFYLKDSHKSVVKSTLVPENPLARQSTFWEQLMNSNEEILVVPDALNEPTFSKFSFITGHPNIRAFASVKLVTSKNILLGVLCIMDDKPCMFSIEQISTLTLLKKQIANIIEFKTSCVQSTELIDMYRNLIERAQEIICRTNEQGRILFFNEAMVKMLGFTPEELLGKHYLDFYSPEFQDNIKNLYRTQRDKKLQDTYFECPILTKDGRKLWIGQNVSTLWKEETLIGFQVIARDITEKRHGEELREQLIRELEEAIYNVKTLSGLLPICASCKKIRDDSGYWSQVETYLMDHTDITLTHGICPECMKKLYPQYYKEKGSVKTAT